MLYLPTAPLEMKQKSLISIQLTLTYPEELMSRPGFNYKIIHVLNLTSLGGVQKQFKSFIESLDDKEKKRHLVIDLTSEKIFNFLKLYFLILKKNHYLHYYNNLGSKTVYILSLLIPSKKIILHERGTIWNIKEKDMYFYKQNIKRSYKILCNSNATKSYICNLFKVSPHKVTVIYNGIETTQIIHTGSKNKNNIAYLGRLDSHKGVDSLIKSFLLINRDDIYLHIAGSGNLESYLKSKKYKNILFHGKVTDSYEFLKDKDILVVPSIREPLGNVVLEAGSMGIPVIASYIDGLAEIFQDKKSGIYLTPKVKITNPTIIQSPTFPTRTVNPIDFQFIPPMSLDTSELKNEINDFLENPSKYEKYGKNLKSIVNSKYTIENYTKHILMFYSQLKR